MLPIIAALIKAGVPILAGAVASKGQEVIEEKLGVKLDDFLASDEKKVQLKQLEFQHEQFLLTSAQENRKIDLEYYREDNKNLSDARDLQKEALKQDDLFAKRFLYGFIAFWSLASSAYLGFVTFGSIPPDNVRFADTILGFMLGVVLASMFQYLLGSSLGSWRKDWVQQMKGTSNVSGN